MPVSCRAMHEKIETEDLRRYYMPCLKRLPCKRYLSMIEVTRRPRVKVQHVVENLEKGRLTRSDPLNMGCRHSWGVWKARVGKDELRGGRNEFTRTCWFERRH